MSNHKDADILQRSGAALPPASQVPDAPERQTSLKEDIDIERPIEQGDFNAQRL